jgi:hypothetical protein
VKTSGAASERSPFVFPQAARSGVPVGIRNVTTGLDRIRPAARLTRFAKSGQSQRRRFQEFLHRLDEEIGLIVVNPVPGIFRQDDAGVHEMAGAAILARI